MLIYKIAWISWLYARFIIRIPYIGLVNIVAGRKIIEEFIQQNAKPQHIANYIICTLKDPKKISLIKTELKQVKSILGQTGASNQAAKIIVDLLNSPNQ